MVIISDTTPLSNLLQIGRLDLLHSLYQEVIVPDAVFEELQALSTFQISIQPIQDADWLTIRTPQDIKLVNKLLAELDLGEAQAIALALETNADYLLIDEKDGRLVAEDYHIPIVGTLGILLSAKQAKLINSIKSEMNALRQIGFWVSDRLYDKMLTISGEE
ncbi:MAG: DUF3368 domain-containing protein [Saprospiraceae bacterium]